MKSYLILAVCILFSIEILHCGEPETQFDTKWIPGKPELLTYRSTSKQGDGLYQLAISKTENTIETYINIITNGFTKTISGKMGADCIPILSKSKIIISGQIVMNTDCLYDKKFIHIQTEMKPYNQIVKNDIPSTGIVIDFSQVPFISRLLPLKPKAEFSFQSLDPKTNSLVPLTLKVIGEEKKQNIDCYKIESHDFEGQAFIWIEKGNQKRIIRFEQPETNRVTELLQ